MGPEAQNPTVIPYRVPLGRRRQDSGRVLRPLAPGTRRSRSRHPEGRGKTRLALRCGWHGFRKQAATTFLGSSLASCIRSAGPGSQVKRNMTPLPFIPSWPCSRSHHLFSTSSLKRHLQISRVSSSRSSKKQKPTWPLCSHITSTPTWQRGNTYPFSHHRTLRPRATLAPFRLRTHMRP